MEKKRPAWMTPVVYNDTRFVDDTNPNGGRASDDTGERSASEVEELLNRGEREVVPNLTTDSAPLDYTKGPHDDELDVPDKDFVSPDDEPLDYTRGEHSDELDIGDDDDYLEDADPDEEIDPFDE
jgi:hypothetical protein